MKESEIDLIKQNIASIPNIVNYYEYQLSLKRQEAVNCILSGNDGGAKNSAVMASFYENAIDEINYINKS